MKNLLQLNVEVHLTFVLLQMQPGAESGDVVVVVQQEPHEIFQRQGSDLFMTHKLGITEALCGCEFIVRHLDGRDLILKSPPGNVIEPGLHLFSIKQTVISRKPTYFSLCKHSLVTVFYTDSIWP